MTASMGCPYRLRKNDGRSSPWAPFTFGFRTARATHWFDSRIANCAIRATKPRGFCSTGSVELGYSTNGVTMPP